MSYLPITAPSARQVLRLLLAQLSASASIPSTPSAQYFVVQNVVPSIGQRDIVVRQSGRPQLKILLSLLWLPMLLPLPR